MEIGVNELVAVCESGWRWEGGGWGEEGLKWFDSAVECIHIKSGSTKSKPLAKTETAPPYILMVGSLHLTPHVHN